MIVKDITLFANRRASFFGRFVCAAMAVLLVVSFFGLTENPAKAYALESDASPAEEQPSDDVAVPQNVYVYLQLFGDAAKAAGQLGLTHNNDGSQKWFTIGVIQLDIPEAAASGESSILLNTEESSDELVSLKADIDKALKALVRFPDNEKLAIYGVQWNELKVCDGATDYPAASGSKAWHLDGELSVQLVEFDINYADAQGQPLTVTEDPDGPAAASSRTLFVAEGSEMAVHDYVVDVPGYKFSEERTKDANNGSLVVKAEAATEERAANADAAEAVANGADHLTLVYEKVSVIVPDDPIIGPSDPVTPPYNPPIKPDGPGTTPVDPDPFPDDPSDKPGETDDPNDNNGETPPAPSDDPTNNDSQRPGNTDTPARPSNPQVNFTVPQTDNRSHQATQSATSAATQASRGFAADERTAVSEPATAAAQSATAETAEAVAATTGAAAEEVLIEDDATPMVSRAPGAEVIVAEAVPLGAFDAPVDPAPWVAGMGAIGTALWGVVAVRRRLVMAQQLATFESQVLGNSAVEADAVAVPNAGHQAL